MRNTDISVLCLIAMSNYFAVLLSCVDTVFYITGMSLLSGEAEQLQHTVYKTCQTTDLSRLNGAA